MTKEELLKTLSNKVRYKEFLFHNYIDFKSNISKSSNCLITLDELLLITKEN